MPAAASLYPRPQLWSGVLSSSSLLFLQVWHGNGPTSSYRSPRGCFTIRQCFTQTFSIVHETPLLPHRMNHLFPTGTQAHTLGKQFTLPYTPSVREKKKRYMYPFHQQ